MKSIQPIQTNLEYYRQASKVIWKYVPIDIIQFKTNEKPTNLPQFRSLTALFPSVVCAIDIKSKEYLYVSNNIASTLGYSPEEFYTEGFLKTIKLFPLSQLEIVLEKIFPLMFETLEKYSTTDNVEDIKISYCTLINHKDGHQHWFLHQITVLVKDENNKAHILIKQVTDINHYKTDDNIIFTVDKKDAHGVYHNVFKKSFLSKDIEHALSEREIEVLHLMGQGYTSKEIADSLFVSEHTIYKHRKNMLKKMNVKRSGDLLKKAMGSGII
jgi:DNA-binding CsgD family transcriptional regulator